MRGTVVERHRQLAAGALPRLDRLPVVLVLPGEGVVDRPLVLPATVSSTSSTGAEDSQLTPIDDGEPTFRMASPKLPARLNLSGMVAPAVLLFTTGRLSSGSRKPVNG